MTSSCNDDYCEPGGLVFNAGVAVVCLPAAVATWLSCGALFQWTLSVPRSPVSTSTAGSSLHVPAPGFLPGLRHGAQVCVCMCASIRICLGGVISGCGCWYEQVQVRLGVCGGEGGV